ncbi:MULTISPECIES: aromatic amino acid transport family protein [Bacillus]|uniref:aromatic amino acid transport family protein n=1 Tax=Bacillus TaxID=1386 RepID=UPI00191BF67E|nr:MULTISPECIES: aromatic amino acid transport family protein [Bacillus]MBT9287273.1 septum formation initiator [Bacillus velezensis]MCX2822668.1 septum formation initiator [Bacillus sp. H1F1]QZY34735.1 septum formation initiator [Bacillus amyloliquefaciens]
MNMSIEQDVDVRCRSSSSNNASYEDPAKWCRQNTIWVLGLFGTAIGAGVLFLPINAGIGGILPLMIITVLAFPITYFSHRALARFVLSAGSATDGILAVTGEYFGAKARRVFTVIYFLAIYSILLMYSVAITNTAQSFIVNQMNMPEPPRGLTAGFLIAGLLFIVRFGQDAVMKTMSLLVYPFIGSLCLMGIYLIPKWNTAILDVTHLSLSGSGQGMFMTVWMTFPVLVLSFNHYSMISPFVVAQRQCYGDKFADDKCAQIQKYSYILMILTVLFFVYSCVFSLSPADLAMAKKQNISILTYLANHFHSAFIACLSPIIAFLAITKSFLGHYIGAYEAMRDIIVEVFPSRNNKKKTDFIILFFMFVTCWLIAYINPSILGIIESISGPIGAVILLLLPMYAIRKLPVLKMYRNKISNVFVAIIGVITVSAIIFALF